jgi:hypothetical protein
LFESENKALEPRKKGQSESQASHQDAPPKKVARVSFAPQQEEVAAAATTSSSDDMNNSDSSDDDVEVGSGSRLNRNQVVLSSDSESESESEVLEPRSAIRPGNNNKK